MTATPFDTLKLSRQLRERAHFDQQQAEGVAEALAEAFQQEIATKADILLLQNDIKRLEERVDQVLERVNQTLALLEQRLGAKMAELEQRLTTRMGAMLVAAIGILLALEKLIK